MPELRMIPNRLLATLVSRLKLWRCSELGASPLVIGRIWVHGPGTLRIGKRVRLDASREPIELYVGAGAEIVLGDDVEIQGGASIEALQSVQIGDECRIGARCKVLDNDFHLVSGNRQHTPPSAPVIIEAGATLEGGAIVLPGARVPASSVVAGGTVVRGRSAGGPKGARQLENDRNPASHQHQWSYLKRLLTDPLNKLWYAVAILRGAVLFRHCQRGARAFAYGRVRVRNQGAIRLGSRVGFRRGMIPSELVCHPGAEIRIGDRTFFNYGVSIHARESVTIGQRCLIASMVRLADTRDGVTAPITVGDDVWIAHGAVIYPGISIGSGSVISAGSVVMKNVPPGSIAIGKPARCISQSLFTANV
jgi:acetyltransferase-like isoleucine patch superfamily enzyme